jgi:hypothetical protein
MKNHQPTFLIWGLKHCSANRSGMRGVARGATFGSVNARHENAWAAFSGVRPAVVGQEPFLEFDHRAPEIRP